MSTQNRSRSRFISEQKPLRQRKQRAEKRMSRGSIDLMELQRNFAEIGKRRHTSSPTWIKMLVFLIAVPVFFLLGYWIAALSLSTLMKVLIAFPVAILGIILSYVVSSMFR